MHFRNKYELKRMVDVKSDAKQTPAALSRKREAPASAWSYFFDDHRDDFNEYGAINTFVLYVEGQYRVLFASACLYLGGATADPLPAVQMHPPLQ